MTIVAKRPRNSRWRRLPGVYRFFEEKGPKPNLDPQRLTLYLTVAELDMAEGLAKKAGGATIQEYCTAMLRRALEVERVRAQMDSIEAQHGRLNGLREIADDPEYLAEWSAEVAAQSRDHPEPVPVKPHSERGHGTVYARVVEPQGLPSPSSESEIDTDRDVASSDLSEAAAIVLRHAGEGDDGRPSFLGNLRRGEAVPVPEVAELGRALHLLEKELRDATAIDRRVVNALHRLAFVSQVLHTDAWPGAFDEWTVDTLRAVQEAVDRILSGQDIRYSSPGSPPEAPQ
jgi:hypothetical protein